MYWPGTTAADLAAAGFEAELALRVTRPGTEPVGSPPGPALQTAGRGQHGAGEPGAYMAPVPSGPPVAGPYSASYTPCMDDPDLFFAELPADVESAKALCRECPIRLACLSGALERREPWGVWGGELFLRGEVVPRKRPRGRPRKSEVAA
jgi:WhiB family transcriptional regulator, redox-sensing transcriptional regulator